MVPRWHTPCGGRPLSETQPLSVYARIEQPSSCLCLAAAPVPVRFFPSLPTFRTSACCAVHMTSSARRGRIFFFLIPYIYFGRVCCNLCMYSCRWALSRMRGFLSSYVCMCVCMYLCVWCVEVCPLSVFGLALRRAHGGGALFFFCEDASAPSFLPSSFTLPHPSVDAQALATRGWRLRGSTRRRRRRQAGVDLPPPPRPLPRHLPFGPAAGRGRLPGAAWRRPPAARPRAAPPSSSSLTDAFERCQGRLPRLSAGHRCRCRHRPPHFG